MTSPHSYPSSPAQSLHVSDHASESTTLQRLVTHFVAAKRSLSATAHVYRANEIVDAARRLIEEAAILTAKNIFVERGVSEEANVLGSLRGGLDTAFKQGNSDFKVRFLLVTLSLAPPVPLV